MKLIVTGSGTAALQAERGPAGYVLNIGGEIVLLDSGTGTLLKCLQAGISYRDIDRIFYSHLHPDHTVDLVPFLFATKYTPGFVRSRPLQLCGPVGFRSFFTRYVDLFGRNMLDVAYEIKISELGETECEYESFKVRTACVAHSENALAYRFEAHGKVFVYSGDTDFCPEIIQLAEDADILLIECSFSDNAKVPGHLTPTEVGRIARESRAHKVLLTHIYPPFSEEQLLDSVSKQFDGEIDIARDFMEIQI